MPKSQAQIDFFTHSPNVVKIAGTKSLFHIVLINLAVIKQIFVLASNEMYIDQQCEYENQKINVE